MTKVTILGQEPKEVKKLKPIEVIKVLRIDNGLRQIYVQSPNNILKWKNIILLCKNYHESEYDLMFGWDYESSITTGSGCTLFLGHFNDGVVSND